MQIDQSIFSTKKPEEIYYYALSGQEEYIDSEGYPRLNSDSDKTYAKIIKNKQSKSMTDKVLYDRFYIKSDPNNNILNPIILYSSKNNDLTSNKHLNKTCKYEYTYKEVTRSVFQKYLQFLLTKNIKWLKDAQRELK